MRLSFNPTTQEIVFDGQRLIVQEVPALKYRAGSRAANDRRSRSDTPLYVEREEDFVGRMGFSEAWVDEEGNITLTGSLGYMNIFVNQRAQLVYLVHPPQEDVAAFYPRMYVSAADQASTTSDGTGTIAWHVSPTLTCKCDKAGCGTGCSNDDCTGIVTCSGRCGSCAWTLQQ